MGTNPSVFGYKGLSCGRTKMYVDLIHVYILQNKSHSFRTESMDFLTPIIYPNAMSVPYGAFILLIQ